jgi:hypothetical protein
MKQADDFGWKAQREETHSEDVHTDERIILNWIFRKQNEMVWTGLIWLRTRKGGGQALVACGNECLGPIKDGGFLK